MSGIGYLAGGIVWRIQDKHFGLISDGSVSIGIASISWERYTIYIIVVEITFLTCQHRLTKDLCFLGC